MQWQALENEAKLATILADSYTIPQLVFKHSTRCGISAFALDKLEQEENLLSPLCTLHYLDLLAYRSISHAIALVWNVPHQSPQVIVLKDGRVVYHASHSAIDAAKIVLSIPH
jgi:bacillithiol system protein YtxJ